MESKLSAFKKNKKPRISGASFDLSAEKGGFEPPVGFPLRQFSKLLVSATHPPFLGFSCLEDCKNTAKGCFAQSKKAELKKKAFMQKKVLIQKHFFVNSHPVRGVA